VIGDDGGRGGGVDSGAGRWLRNGWGGMLGHDEGSSAKRRCCFVV
jgi:hypothetical protein